MKRLFFPIVLMLLVAASSCSQEQGPESPEPEGTAPVVESITLGSGEALENGAAHVSTASGSITVLYDQAVSLADASAITLNELQVSAQGMNVRIGIEYPELEYSTEYTLTIPEEYASQEGHWGVIVADAPNATHYIALDDTAAGVQDWIDLTTYSVKLPANLENGSVTADPCKKDKNSSYCDWCEFRAACRFDETAGDKARWLRHLSDEDFWQQVGGEQ